MTPPHQHSYAQFRLISAQELEAFCYPKTLAFRLRSWLERTLSGMKTILFSSSDLEVWHTYDANGHLSWSAYDPITRNAIHRASDTEIRVWIEQRHRMPHR